MDIKNIFLSFRRRPESTRFKDVLDAGLGFGVMRRSTAYIHVGVRWHDDFGVTGTAVTQPPLHHYKLCLPIRTVHIQCLNDDREEINNAFLTGIYKGSIYPAYKLDQENKEATQSGRYCNMIMWWKDVNKAI